METNKCPTCGHRTVFIATGKPPYCPKCDALPGDAPCGCVVCRSGSSFAPPQAEEFIDNDNLDDDAWFKKTFEGLNAKTKLYVPTPEELLAANWAQDPATDIMISPKGHQWTQDFYKLISGHTLTKLASGLWRLAAQGGVSYYLTKDAIISLRRWNS